MSATASRLLVDLCHACYKGMYGEVHSLLYIAAQPDDHKFNKRGNRAFNAGDRKLLGLFWVTVASMDGSNQVSLTRVLQYAGVLYTAQRHGKLEPYQSLAKEHCDLFENACVAVLQNVLPHAELRAKRRSEKTAPAEETRSSSDRSFVPKFVLHNDRPADRPFRRGPTLKVVGA